MSPRDDLYVAQRLVADPKGGKAKRHPAGRFVVKGGRVVHLEDYHNLLKGLIPEGPLTKSSEEAIRNSGPDLAVASLRDVGEGRRLDFVPEHRFSGPLPPPPEKKAPPVGPETYLYHRAGHDHPHLLEVRGTKLALDGSELSTEETAAVLENLRGGAAELRRARPQELQKAEPPKEWTPESALTHLDQQHPGDEHSKDAVSALRQYLFEDPMNEGVGNKYAYNQYRAKDYPGSWASLDMNDFKHVNDTYGHDVGDALIRAAGSAFRAGADPAKVKLFRSGGDEYALHASNPEDAYAAVRSMREHLDELPPINGEYKPSMSVGFGNDFGTADSALRLAKKGKFGPGGQRIYLPGNVPHLAHSLIPGKEGPVPLSLGASQPTAAELAPLPLTGAASGATGSEGQVSQKPTSAPSAPL